MFGKFGELERNREEADSETGRRESDALPGSVQEAGRFRLILFPRHATGMAMLHFSQPAMSEICTS